MIVTYGHNTPITLNTKTALVAVLVFLYLAFSFGIPSVSLR